MTLLSLWHDRHRRPAAAPAEVGGHHDVVVVGGGLTGLTTALLLGRAGRSVLVLEARGLGAGTTGGSTAKLSLLQGTRLSAIARQHGTDVVRQYVTANAEGQAWVARFCEDHGVEAQRRPAYTYANGGSGARRIRRELDVARGVDLPVTWVDRPDLPFPTAGAVRLDDQLQVDPMALVEALAEQARAHGADVVEGARVRRVRGNRPVRVETEAGEVTADTVVVATNMPILDRGGYFARMTPGRSYGLSFRTGAQAVDGMYLSADAPSRSLRDAPDPAGALLLVGGEGHTTGRGGSTARRLDALRSWTAEHYPGAVETHAWSAQDYLPAHQLPVAGPLLPGQEQVQVAGGYSKWGMTNAVAAALALSARLLGGHIEWADALRSVSRRELTGVPQATLYNAEVAVEMSRGWIAPLLGRSGGGRPEEGQGTVRYDHLGTPTAEARVGGVEHRVSGVCTHLGGIVRWNDAERSWDCPLHGSRFDVDGEVLEGPATCGLRRR